MREILFRGKRKDNDWAYGDLNHYSSFTGVADYIVISETVGQYTGLTDKNGKKIFEGDIVKFNGELYDELFYIIFVDGCFRICRNGQYSLTLHNIKSALEVIGNIYDNPELLKGVNDDA